MYIPNCPEDSVLRRHFEAAAERKRREWLRQPPSDSVLRRHFEQLSQAAAAPITSPKARPAAASSALQAAPARPAPPPRPISAPPPTPEPARRGGLFGWLGRLFGG